MILAPLQRWLSGVDMFSRTIFNVRPNGCAFTLPSILVITQASVSIFDANRMLQYKQRAVCMFYITVYKLKYRDICEYNLLNWLVIYLTIVHQWFDWTSDKDYLDENESTENSWEGQLLVLLIGRLTSLDKRCGLASCYGNWRTADVSLVMGTDAEELGLG